MTIMERAIQRIENASTVSALPQPTRHPIPQRQGSNPHALKLFAKLGWSLFSVDYHRMIVEPDHYRQKVSLHTYDATID
jgi:hypothetical protein